MRKPALSKNVIGWAVIITYVLGEATRAEESLETTKNRKNQCENCL